MLRAERKITKAQSTGITSGKTKKKQLSAAALKAGTAQARKKAALICPDKVLEAARVETPQRDAELADLPGWVNLEIAYRVLPSRNINMVSQLDMFIETE